MPTGTVRLHRILAAPPERVYKAFTDATAFPKWYPPFGFTCQVDHFEAKVGGSYHMSFTNFSTGSSHAFGGAISVGCVADAWIFSTSSSSSKSPRSGARSTSSCTSRR